MKPWDDARDLILPDVPGCPWEMARSRLILAAREFFSRSGTWSATLDPIPSQLGVAEYPEIVPTANMEIVRIRQCYYGTKELEPLTPDEFFDRQMDAPSGLPEFMTVDADVLILSGAPTESGVDIVVEATFKPSLANEGLPNDLWDQHIEAIVEGAKARLYKSPKKPYTDLALSADARGAFLRLAGIARTRAAQGSTKARRRVRAHYF